ncbi:MAG: hypothetical protein JSV96_18640 [Candidatus Aminicenantes bacterium]|nr:MAG: hypothetical protein JSV96_18640 [Candidatus Aminicenantes bacterium]
MKKTSGFFICFCLMFFPLVFYSLEKEHFFIGQEDGDGFLAIPRHVQEGPDGNIYVFDWGDFFIKVYSPGGKYLRRMGGRGQGPGEVQRADGAGFGFTQDAKLYFTEFFRGHRWITFIELSGEFIKVLTPEINESFGINDAIPLEDGGFLVHFSFSSKPEMKKDYYLYKSPQSLVRIDQEGKVISEIINKEHFTLISSHGDGATSNLPFIPVFEWIPFKDDSILFTDGMSKNFKVYNYKGSLIREIETALPAPVKVKSRELNAWRQRREELMMQRNPGWYNRFGKVIEKYKKSLYDKPNVSGISSTPEGNLIIAGPVQFEEMERDYWLLDESGKILTQMRSAVWGIRMCEHFIFFYTTDEDQNELVHCVKRRGPEKEDFLRIKDYVISSSFP